MLYKNKYDTRGSGKEGAFADSIYDRVLKESNVSFRNASIREDCAGKDKIRANGEADDVKGRKGAGSLRVCLEVCSANNGPIGSGWSYHDVYIAQMMIYVDENKHITDIIFGRYYAPDAVKNILDKLDLTVETKINNELRKLYPRWSYNKDRDTYEHRGATVCVEYSDLESLPSFERIQVPRKYYAEIMKFYNDLAVIQARGKPIAVPYDGIK